MQSMRITLRNCSPSRFEDVWLRVYRTSHYCLASAFFANACRSSVSLVATALLASSVAAQEPAGNTMQPGAVFRDCADCPEMVVIPSGEFTMGDIHAWRGARAGPPRAVRVGAFAAGRFEVTVSEYAAFVRETGHDDDGGCWVDVSEDGSWEHRTGASWNNTGFGQTNDHPAVCVSWNDAKAYVQWLNDKTPGSSYRLLTEAEWEYAARAQTKTDYWWGDTPSRNYANYGMEACCQGAASGADLWVSTSPVGRFPANPFGLHDMHGNAYEWVEDCYRKGYGGAPSDGSALTTAGCPQRVRRGGTWYAIPGYMTSFHRASAKASERNFYGGFRVARTL